jgi:hypothetical protein
VTRKGNEDIVELAPILSNAEAEKESALMVLLSVLVEVDVIHPSDVATHQWMRLRKGLSSSEPPAA